MNIGVLTKKEKMILKNYFKIEISENLKDLFKE